MREMPDTVSFESLNRLARRSLEEKSSCNSSWRMGEQPKKLLTWCQTNASALSSNIIDGGPPEGLPNLDELVKRPFARNRCMATASKRLKTQSRNNSQNILRERTHFKTKHLAPRERTQRRRPEMVDARGSARECRRSTLLSQTQTNMDYRQPLREGRPG